MKFATLLYVLVLMICSKSLIHGYMNVQKAMTTFDLDIPVGESFVALEIKETNSLKAKMKKGRVALKSQL
jgi:hypothetical protein